MTSLPLQISITAVIVLYRQTVEESAAFQTLQQAYREASDTGLQLHTLLYDNTPGGQCSPGNLPANTVYMAAPCNEGLAGAYNLAAAYGRQQGSDWLLTLDQDTKLPHAFLQQMAGIANSVANTPVIAAIVPQVMENGRMLSPYCFRAGALPMWYPRGFSGCPKRAVFAFNSGACIQLSALRQAGGYDPWFWLDNSDALIFKKLHRYGKHVFIAGNLQVEHHFSMLDLGNRVSLQRYRNILLAESAFWDLEMNALAGGERTVRLFLRVVKQLRRRDSRPLLHTTVEFLKRRMFWSRHKRLRHWREETLSQFPGLALAEASTTLPKPRPMVSVCMAAYNNSPYIEQQLRSIVQQLQPGDELVVVDDASTDDTAALIQALQSPFVRFIPHSVNQGVVATFEDALRCATGDILFLADGDDIWSSKKVARFLEVFEQVPEATIVTSRVGFIDQHGNPVEDDMYSNRKVFRSSFRHNLLRNHFQGSAMALRASLLGDVLPFPRGVLFLHDHWIGMRNARLGSGKAVCLEEALLFYRRHGHNLSGRISRGQQAKLRLQLLWRVLFR